MINFINDSGGGSRVDPDDVAAVSSTDNPMIVELMFMDGAKLHVFGTMAEVIAKLEGEEDAERSNS